MCSYQSYILYREKSKNEYDEFICYCVELQILERY